MVFIRAFQQYNETSGLSNLKTLIELDGGCWVPSGVWQIMEPAQTPSVFKAVQYNNVQYNENEDLGGGATKTTVKFLQDSSSNSNDNKKYKPSQVFQQVTQQFDDGNKATTTAAKDDALTVWRMNRIFLQVKTTHCGQICGMNTDWVWPNYCCWKTTWANSHSSNQHS